LKLPKTAYNALVCTSTSCACVTGSTSRPPTAPRTGMSPICAPGHHSGFESFWRAAVFLICHNQIPDLLGIETACNSLFWTSASCACVTGSTSRTPTAPRTGTSPICAPGNHSGFESFWRAAVVLICQNQIPDLLGLKLPETACNALVCTSASCACVPGSTSRTPTDPRTGTSPTRAPGHHSGFESFWRAAVFWICQNHIPDLLGIEIA
jgi:hypothetical protein